MKNGKEALVEGIKTRVRVYLTDEDVMDRWTIIIGGDVFTMSDNATAPNGVNQYMGTVREVDFSRIGIRANIAKVPYQVLLGIKDRL